MSFSSGIKKTIEFLTPSSSYDIVMRNAIYFILFMIFVILVLPYVKVSGLTSGDGRILEISTPSSETFKFYENTLNNLFFYVLGAYAINKIGWQMTISIITLGVTKTGGNVEKVLEMLFSFMVNENNKENTNKEEISKGDEK